MKCPPMLNSIASARFALETVAMWNKQEVERIEIGKNNSNYSSSRYFFRQASSSFLRKKITFCSAPSATFFW